MSSFTLENLALLLAEAVSRKTSADSQQIQYDLLEAMFQERWNPNETTLPLYIKKVDNYIAFIDAREPYVYDANTAVDEHAAHLHMDDNK